jgi:hypothetical protein
MELQRLGGLVVVVVVVVMVPRRGLMWELGLCWRTVRRFAARTSPS